MFKFKMLTKVLVAVFVLGLLIESNLKLSIALSIDLDAPINAIRLEKSWPSEGADTSAALNEQVDPNGSGSSSASRTSTSLETTTTTNTIIITSNDAEEKPTASPPGLVQTIESNGKLNYFGEIYVGERQEPFMVLIDLTSSAFWLPSSECKSVYCISRHKYNKNNSATHIEDGREFNMSYTGNVHGAMVSTRLVRDKVTFAGVSLEDQLFGEAVHMEGEPFAYMPVDGFLGLGFKDLQAKSGQSPDPATETIFERMYRLGLFEEPIFSLLNKNQPIRFGYSADSGELILGKLAEGYEQADMTYVPVTHVDYWEFHIESVTVRQSIGDIDIERGCESACPAILDTGSPFISGHYTDVDRINKAMGGYPVSDGFYRLSHCDLSQMPDLVFNIGGVEFALEPQDYVTVNEIRGFVHSCYSNLRVVKAEQYPFWILGEIFMKRHYIVFDYGQKRLGFAKSKDVAQESEEEMYQRIPARKKHII